MDNEASQAVKDLLTKDFGLEYQLVPPHIHRRNAAERAIRTFKNHFIVGLCSTDPNFPLRLWDRLLSQAEITLNLLRASRKNPNISAQEAVYGPFDFNKTPMAPPGSKVLIHEKPSQRKTWDPHGVQGWYLGPALKHYRCYRCYVNSTHAERISDTVEFFPTESTTPIMSAQEAAITAAEALNKALQQKQKPNNLPELLEPTKVALNQLDKIFQAKPVESLPRVEPIPHHASSPRVAKPVIEDAPIASRTRHKQQQPEPINHFANSVIHPVTGKPMEYRQLITDPATRDAWNISAANEFGRLAQGVGGRVKGTDTIRFIHHSEIPADRTPTYPRFVCTERPQKTEVNCTRMTLGGNLIDYPGDVSTTTAEMETTKILFNSVVSTKNTKFCSMDVTNFYLNTPLDRPEYVKIPVNLIPQEIVEEYKLKDKVHNGFVLAIVEKGMYGLPQSGILANKLLKEHMDIMNATTPLDCGATSHDRSYLPSLLTISESSTVRSKMHNTCWLHSDNFMKQSPLIGKEH
jgi:hypothetical protein